MKLHHSLTADVIIEAVERYNSTLDNPGFCVVCGVENDGCEPDMRKSECAACGEHAVYGAQELLFRVA